MAIILVLFGEYCAGPGNSLEPNHNCAFIDGVKSLNFIIKNLFLIADLVRKFD